MTVLGRSAAVAVSALLLACTSLPRPRVMSQADAAAESPAVVAGKKLVPQAFAHAESLRHEAETAYDQGDQTAAQVLGEHAMTAYTHAVILARIVQAQARERAADERLTKARARVVELDEEQKRVAAEADDLELQVKVARDAIAPAPAGAPTAERDLARRDATRALATQARLLCLAARLLAPDAAGVADDLKTLDAFDDEIARAALAPIDKARKLNTSCLEHLTKARRPAMLRDPSAGSSDALLSELSAAGLIPFRDDRGVVLTLRGAFKTDTELTPDATSLVQTIARTSAAHPTFPVLVVIHGASSKALPRDQQRAKTLVDALTKQGAAHVDSRAVGGAAPIVDPKAPGAADRNDRVEIIFVSPGS